MTVLSRFSFAAEKALARELTQRLVKEVPPSLVENKRKLLSVNKVTRLLETSFQTATDFQVEHKLGFVGRAALANAFKWELKESGYPDDFVEMATEGLVVALAKAKPSAAPKG